MSGRIELLIESMTTDSPMYAEKMDKILQFGYNPSVGL
jgi:hypothetical protein